MPIFLDDHFYLEIASLQKIKPELTVRSFQEKINKHREVEHGPRYWK
jgi:hypothetical protein